ncbi:MAG: acyltransferase family protein [Acidocella sp.]|uniref:acyltransferase family protein n=1 Tax=Acidocella sp. TaxID=50710 RepID=UPI003FC46E5D
MHASQDVPRAKLESLEVGRFLAASLVMFSHLPWLTHAFAANPKEAVFGGWELPGPFAVQYFFTLSGFVMITAHHQDFGQAKVCLRFWWRRACRIYPMYWLSLLATLLCLATPPATHTLIKLVALAPIHTVNPVFPAWSLHVEIAFYVIFGLCLLPWIGKPLLALWVATVLALCWEPGLQSGIVPMLLQSHAALFIFGTNYTFFHVQFFSGLLAGWLYKNRPPGPRAAWALLLAGLATLLTCLPGLRWGDDYFTPSLAPSLAFGFGAVLLALAALERAGTFRLGAVARRLGIISYPLYIIHSSCMLAFVTLAGPKLAAAGFRVGLAGQYAILVGAALAIYAICTAAAFLIDQPLQRLLRRLPV